MRLGRRQCKLLFGVSFRNCTRPIHTSVEAAIHLHCSISQSGLVRAHRSIGNSGLICRLAAPRRRDHRPGQLPSSSQVTAGSPSRRSCEAELQLCCSREIRGPFLRKPPFRRRWCFWPMLRSAPGPGSAESALCRILQSTPGCRANPVERRGAA